MITKIAIKNFKSLEDIQLACRPLNVLTGLNGMGKSSIIQAILLLRQSHERGFLKENGLFLNGELVNIGTGKDAFYEFAEKEEIVFEFDFLNEKAPKTWTFTYETNEDNVDEKYYGANFLRYSKDSDRYDDIDELSLFKHDSFRYLNTDRWVSNEYTLSEFDVVNNRSLGKHGQYSAHFLEHFGRKIKVHPLLRYPNSEVDDLATQLTLWLNKVSPGTRIVTERIPGTDSVKLRYIMESESGSSNEVRPLNAGFGITYILSVLVAILSSKEGDLLIIENPESHIHPKGQSMIGKLLSRAAKAGTQVFIETHSDHIINGILISVLETNQGIIDGIESSDVSISFIDRKKNSIASEIHTIEIQPNGRMTGMPDGFFDQYSKDLKAIIGF